MTKTKMLGKAAAVATVLAMFAGALPASAAMNSSSITITTTNRGDINNTTDAKSHTGKNTADGSIGGAGGTAGSVLGGTGSNNNGGASAGNAGAGGAAGTGGWVETGNAKADAGTNNDLNDTLVEVAVPTDMNSSALALVTDNSKTADCGCNTINNTTRAKARTGSNHALGSIGGAAGNGGTVDGQTGSYNNGGASAGNAGAGGVGGGSLGGGTVKTGDAESKSGTINLLNAVIVRVHN